MAGLQRSSATFRRSGSSGLVWEDSFSTELTQTNTTNNSNNKDKDSGSNKDVSGEGVEYRELRPSHSAGPIGMMRRTASNGGRTTAYRTGKVSPAIDPPSPKVSACGFCGFFGKHEQQKQNPVGAKQHKKKARR